MSINPDRLDILRTLNSKGPLAYSELQSLVGFKTERESGQFAYHMKKLRIQALVTRNSEVYEITNLGKLEL